MPPHTVSRTLWQLYAHVVCALTSFSCTLLFLLASCLLCFVCYVNLDVLPVGHRSFGVYHCQKTWQHQKDNTILLGPHLNYFQNFYIYKCKFFLVTFIFLITFTQRFHLKYLNNNTAAYRKIISGRVKSHLLATSHICPLVWILKQYSICLLFCTLYT